MSYRPRRWAVQELSSEEEMECWEELVEWVEMIRDRYQLHYAIPKCWFRHVPLRHTLLALMLGWKSAYLFDPDGYDDPAVAAAGLRVEYADDPIAWHEHFFWPTLRELGRISPHGDCSTGVCSYRHRRPEVDDDWRECL